MLERSYPTSGAWRLDEVDGVLYYQKEPIGPIATLRRWASYDHPVFYILIILSRCAGRYGQPACITRTSMQFIAASIVTAGQ
jgi:hypothetical protein